MPKIAVAAPKMVSFFTAGRSRIMRRCVLIISDKIRASFMDDQSSTFPRNHAMFPSQFEN